MRCQALPCAFLLVLVLPAIPALGAQAVTSEQIVGLPLNGRSFVQVIALSTGVALPPASSFPRINGGRPRTNEYLLDGISVLQPEPGQVAFFPVFDASILTGPVANFPVADSYNRGLERDLSSGDIPNVFVGSFTYALPFGPGRLFEPNGIAGAFAKGWEVTGIVAVQSGLPLAVTQVTNFNAFAGFGTQRPNLVMDPELHGVARSTAEWFNTDAFKIAPVFTLGTSSRNPVRGPEYRNFDLAIIKKTAITERFGVEFRTEFFNLTNTPPLGAPATIAGAPGFGSITSAGDPRVIQFGLKLHF